MTTQIQKERILGRYMPEAVLGEGSFGRVLQVKDIGTGKHYALKTPTGDVSVFLEREVLFWLGLPEHPNIVTAITVDFDEASQPYLLLELVSGGSLRSRLTRKPWSREQALPVLRDIAEGMKFANLTAEIAHLDLKPENLLLGRHEIAKITDFGLVRQIRADPLGGTYPNVSACTGTSRYRAPEVILETGRVDQRCDIYAFGLIAFEMFAGHLPFPRNTILRDLYSSDRAQDQLWRSFDVAGSYGPLGDGDLREFLASCLEIEPAERLPSFQELAYRIEKLGGTWRWRQRPGWTPERGLRIPMRALGEGIILRRRGDSDGAMSAFNRCILFSATDSLTRSKAISSVLEILTAEGRANEATQLEYAGRGEFERQCLETPLSEPRAECIQLHGSPLHSPGIDFWQQDEKEGCEPEKSALLDEAQEACRTGHYRTALACARRALTIDPVFGLRLASIVLGGISKGDILTSPEPPSSFDRNDPLFDPLAIECSECRRFRFYEPMVGIYERVVILRSSLGFMQCAHCRYTVCDICRYSGARQLLRCPRCSKAFDSSTRPIPTGRAWPWCHPLIACKTDAVVVIRAGLVPIDQVWLQDLLLDISPDVLRDPSTTYTKAAGGARLPRQLADDVCETVNDLVEQGALDREAPSRMEVVYGTDHGGVPFAIAKVLHTDVPAVDSAGTADQVRTGPTEDGNMGSRQETLAQADAYWRQRMTQVEKQPFVLAAFPQEADARAALTELPCIQVATDSGKLICTEVLTYGYYRTDDGTYEAIVCGSDLTSDLFTRAHESFEQHGGRLLHELPPKREAARDADADGDAARVVFVREERQISTRDGSVVVYRIYSAPDAASAKAFLRTRRVKKPLRYLVVETRDGNYCRDIDGMYKE